MPMFILTSKHSIESCPMNNERSKKIYVECTAKLEALMKKHGVKMIGGWASIPDHKSVMVYDAPGFETFQAFSMESEVMRWMSINSNCIEP
ncbi:MAG: hypothetical protein LUP94_02325, partial [Candidatus Methanomethylicus sp.]|nr:hypothetical protein [Candidatus Methanomethylicus sp.]